MIRASFICILIPLLAGTATTATAQVGDRPGAPAGGMGGQVQGRVVAADTGEPVAGISVSVRSPADASIVAGAIAGIDGAFRIEGVRPGSYYVQATSLGYQPYRSAEFTLRPPSPRIDLGTLRLASSPLEADEIEVTVDRPTVALEPDRTSYTARDIAPAAVTASEVLESVPSVFVDADGKVSLRGNESVAIQINGRPAPVRGDQLDAYLQQLPAHAVERVEVIPTPSARYDPEGMAGIINIVMKQNAELGTSGGVTLGAATTERYNAGGNVGHQRGPFSLLTTYGFNHDERHVRGINDREVLDPDATSPAFTEQDLIGSSRRQGHNLSTTLEVRMGARNVLTNALVLNRRGSTQDNFNTYVELDASRSVTDRYARPSEEEDESWLVDYTLGFRRTWESRVHELSTELRFNREDDDEGVLRWRQPVADLALRVEIEQGHTDGLERELEGRIDYIRPLGEAKLEVGYDGNARWREEEYLELEDSLGTGVWVRSDLSNAFEFEEHVHAVYGVASRRLGSFEFQGGLRTELAKQEFALADEAFPHTYTSLFPSAIAVYDVDEANQLKLSYSRRVRRPRTRQLNPFPSFDDVQNVFIGNPELDPEYTDALELGWTRWGSLGSLQVTPFYRHTTDVIRFVVDTDAVVDGRPVTLIRHENLATSDSWGADVNATVELGEWFDGLASFNLHQLVTDGGSESSLSTNAITWSTRVNGTVRLSPTLSLQAMSFYRAPREIEGGGRYSGFSMTSMTLQQKLWDDRASLNLRVVDPFDRMAFRSVVNDENLIQITEREPRSRSLQLTFQYTFGRPTRNRPTQAGPSQPEGEPEPEGIFP